VSFQDYVTTYLLATVTFYSNTKANWPFCNICFGVSNFSNTLMFNSIKEKQLKGEDTPCRFTKKLKSKDEQPDLGKNNRDRVQRIGYNLNLRTLLNHPGHTLDCIIREGFYA
jgi:hypothetical protein